MSVSNCVYVSPSHATFLHGGTGGRPSYYTRGALKQEVGAERPSPTRPSATGPSYNTCGALKTRVGCRASIAHVSILLHAWSPKNKGGCRASISHASILLHAWSPKNEGWVQSVHRPRVHLITHVEP